MFDLSRGSTQHTWTAYKHMSTTLSPAPADTALLKFRERFPILHSTTYLISNSLGAMPRGVFDAAHDYANTWGQRGVRAWEEKWWMMSAEVGDQIGELMNAPAGSTSVHQNV